MTIRNLVLTTIAAAALVLCSGHMTMAQQKNKKASAPTAHSYKECCDRAHARFYVDNGKATCFAMSEQQQEALASCIHERGIRVEWQGQKGI